MKTVYFLILIAAFSTMLGCNYIKSDHPQADVADEYATNLTAKSIIQYTDSIDKNLTQLSKSTSLVYMLGDLSFYVEKYSLANKAILVIEHAYNGGISNSLKRYYFKNDSLILEKDKNELVNEEGTVFKDTRTYLRSNTVFKIENKTAATQSAINSLPYIDLPLSKNNKPDQSYLENVNSLNNVLNGSDKFDVVFESITTYPDSRYIILRSKIQNSYSASVLVKERDAFIDSLLNDPINFKDQKLNFKWVVKDNEAIYVPVANNTSANGLNK
ncbi:hypothetical protein GM921_10185 [Pedobacter sp. LMG 31464]|uniref:Lipoprotein n=1 Tax=Pedobacter planticolens TaxID=2679964 RepID=A0A923DZ97_9SPHI|nr:hypothetical protein [Pedobacter planticolens]MBB2145855.1 hypothetical protein [Pedobacter planticolens]